MSSPIQNASEIHRAQVCAFMAVVQEHPEATISRLRQGTLHD